jgi:hypothetical protein
MTASDLMPPETGSRELYAQRPHAGIVQANERARAAATEALAIRLQEFAGQPPPISPGFSVRLKDHMVSPGTARAVNHK